MEEGVDEGEPADIDEPSHRVSLLTSLLHRAMLLPQIAQRVFLGKGGTAFEVLLRFLKREALLLSGVTNG